MTQLAALWIRRTSSGVVRRRVAAAEMDRIQALIQTLPEARDQGWRRDAAAVGQLLLGGIPLGGVESALIVPDGNMYSLPFELLSLPGSGLLIESLAVSYLPSAALLLRSEGDRRASPPWKEQLLAFGDPLAPAAGNLPGDQAWARLPDSARELKLIAAALRGRAEIHAGQDNLKRRLVEARHGA